MIWFMAQKSGEGSPRTCCSYMKGLRDIYRSIYIHRNITEFVYVIDLYIVMHSMFGITYVVYDIYLVAFMHASYIMHASYMHCTYYAMHIRNNIQINTI